MFYSPTKVAIAGILIWLVIWLLLPVVVIGEIAPGALLYAALCYLSFFIGAALWGGRRGSPEVSPWEGPLRRGLFWGTVITGLLGMGLRIYDRLLRGVEYGANAADLREALTNSSNTIPGIASAILFPFCLIPLMLLLSSSDRRKKGLLLIAVTVFALPMAESFFQLSRSFMLLTVGIAFATIVITRYGGRALNRKLLLRSVVGILALVAVSSAIFSVRLTEGRRELSDSVYDSVYAAYLQPNDTARRAVYGSGRVTSFAMLSVLPNGMYYLSGAYEFSALWDRPGDQPFAYGQLHFYVFAKVFYTMIGSDYLTAQRVQDFVYRDGVFQTFFGPLWVDFGWFALLLMAPFGYIMKRMAAMVSQGSVAYLPLYCYLIIVVFFMPVVNFLISGFGILAITAFIIFLLIARNAEAAPQRRGVA